MGFPTPTRTGDIVLRVEDAAKAYDLPLFTGLTFDILRGERWGILGPNGSGKTTLLRCVMGQTPLDAGAARLGTGVKVGYLEQLTAGLSPEVEAVEAIRPEGKEFVEQQRRDLLARFGLTGDMVFQKVASLSGGERSRAGLARISAEEANFLLLDEPTNHLDLWARDALERTLHRFGGTTLLVSHDRYFLNRVVDHLLVVEQGGFRIIEGNYDTYLHLTREGHAGESNTATDGCGSTSSAPGRRSTSQEPKRRQWRFPYRKLEDLEDEIHQRESQLGELQADLTLPEVLRDGDRVRGIQAEISENDAALAKLYEHWEEAAERN